MTFKAPTLAVDIIKIRAQNKELLLQDRLVSLKYDGFRIMTPDGVVLTRSMKALPNLHASRVLSDRALINTDMEIMCTAPNAEGAFNEAQSLFKRAHGEPNVFAFVFDDISPNLLNEPYRNRLDSLMNRKFPDFVTVVEQVPCEDMNQLNVFYERALDDNYEGVMIRDANMVYEQRRATENNQFLVKMKPFKDEEVTLVSLEEGKTNNNPAFIAENGRTKRSTLAENMVPSGMVGTLHCIRDNGAPCRVSPGKLTHQQRIHMLQNPKQYIGRRLTERSMDYGQLASTGNARQGRFLRWRDSFDQ